MNPSNAREDARPKSYVEDINAPKYAVKIEVKSMCALYYVAEPCHVDYTSVISYVTRVHVPGVWLLHLTSGIVIVA